MTKTRIIKGGDDYKFYASTDWSPAKTRHLSSFTEAIIDAALNLVTKESFPVSMIDLKKNCGYEHAESAAASLRNALQKRIGKSKIGQYSIHIVKDAAGKQVSIRIRKK